MSEFYLLLHFQLSTSQCVVASVTMDNATNSLLNRV